LKVKASLHNHTVLSDGFMTPEELIHTLRKKGFRVIAITDHNTWTLPHPAQIPEDVVFLNGVEWTFRWHIIKLELPLRHEVRALSWTDLLDLARIDWLAHPARWGLNPNQIRRLIREYKLDGAELFNRCHRQFEGEIPDAIHLAVDDVHARGMIGKCWIEIETDSLDKETILEKIKRGEFHIERRL